MVSSGSLSSSSKREPLGEGILCSLITDLLGECYNAEIQILTVLCFSKNIYAGNRFHIHNWWNWRGKKITLKNLLLYVTLCLGTTLEKMRPQPKFTDIY